MRRGDGGQSLVELALTLPVLLALACGIVTLSLVGVARLATENAASEAARTLALTNDDGRALSTARAAAAPLRLDALNVRFEPSSEGTRPRGTLVRVLVRYRVPLPLGLGGALVEGSAARRMEYVDVP